MRRSEVAEDYYELLAVPVDARLQDIKRAYRRRARELHPDAYGGKATEVRFHAVTVAYETLRDPELRRRYDDSRWHAREAERRLREESAERRRREEAQRHEAERRRREEAQRREAERRRREEIERRRREEQAALSAARRRLDEESARRQRSQARAPRILFACAVICCALGVGGTLLTLHKRDQALELHRAGLPAAATVRSFHEERVAVGDQPTADAKERRVEVELTARDGRRRSATLEKLRSRYRPGEKVEVVYDRGDPGRIALADPCGASGTLACGRDSISYLGLSALGILIGIGFLVTSLMRRRSKSLA